VVEYDPASYPAPEVIFDPPYSPPVPAPTPAPGAISQIDDFFDVDIDGDTLTLTHQSGAGQTFHRVTGD
jgi:hypothetical protein